MATKKVSEITAAEVAEYLRLDEASPSELQQIDTFIGVAQAFVRSYTGLTAAEVDTYPDIVIAVYVLCQDMYDNRSYYVDSENVNKVVAGVLGMHCRNFLPGAITATVDNLTTTVNTAVSLHPLANDCIPFGSVITTLAGTAAVVATPITIDNATVVLNADGTVTVTPDADYTGTITFEYVARTPADITVTSRVVVVVEAADNA